MNNDLYPGNQETPPGWPGNLGSGGPEFGQPAAKKSNLALILAVCLAVCVCGGIPILAAILFPVFANSKDAAQASVCRLNLKQISFSMDLYSEDNGDRLPPAPKWQDATFQYVNNQFIYQCPKSDSKESNRSDYAMNQSLSMAKTDEIEHPESTIMLFEASGPGRNRSGPPEMLPNPPRHGSRGNTIAFADGAVKRLRDSED